MELIDKAAVIAEIERKKDEEVDYDESSGNFASYADQIHYSALDSVENFINTLEVKEVDLEKLGEIARHLIAIKDHIEDMRLYKEEWSVLEKIGYPERFKVQKGE